MPQPKPETSPHTYGDYLTWNDGKRYELIDGAVFAMSPAPDVVHQEIALEVASQIKTALQGKKCRPFIAPLDVRFPRPNQSDARTDTVLQPDVLIVCDPDKIDRHGIRGAPDWILEVLSPSSSSRDQVHKRRVYERAGVREFWLVHPNDRLLTVYELKDGAYGKPDIQELKGQTALKILPDVVVAWDVLVAGLPPVVE